MSNQQDNEPSATAASAVAQSDALNATLLASQAERTMANLQTKNQSLTQQCDSYQSQVNSLNDKLTELQSHLKAKNEEADKIGELAKGDLNKLKVAEERERDVSERMARVDVEADSLRQEISRLTASSTALSAQVTELQSSSTLSSSSAAPLQFENTRLKTELSSLNSHCKWLEEELKSRSNQGAEHKIKSAKMILGLRSELNEVKVDYDEVLAQVSSLSMQNESYRRRIDSAQRELLDKDQDHADTVHELKLDVQSERRLVSLNKENIARLEERYNDAVRGMGSMKALAAAAENDREQEVLAVRAGVEIEYKNALEHVEKDNERRIAEYQKQLDDALVEKAQIEDEFMGGSGRRAITAGGEGPALQLTDGEPMTLTKLYVKLADTQDEARRERADKKRLELYLERVQQEVESAAPRQRQERKEYELAMTQNQEMHSRLNEAWEESNTARRELQQLQRELTDTSRECHELRLENSDMAKQVQTLLQKSLGGEDLAAEIQDQNQRLLREHHRMSMSISDLQEKLDNDNVQQQLEELEAMKEERENQARLVANIVQQRDLYRALLNKNDQSLLAEYGADGAIIAAKDQIEKYTEVDTRNKYLETSVTTFKAELTSITNEKVGVEERLLRLDAHSNEISVTNTRLQAEITAAHAASARSNAEATFHVEKVGRLEDALEVARIDLNRANDDKRSLQRLSEDLQSALSVAKTGQSKVEEQLRQVAVRVRLAEANCNALKDTETRLNAENDSLRSELARHVALHESMQKIEASLSTRGNEFQNRLEGEVATLTATLSSEKSQHSLAVEKLQNQLADAELSFRDAEKQKEAALGKALSAKDDLIKANGERKSIFDKCELLEKELNLAKVKLGDSDADTSDLEKIENLSMELASTKAELEAANKKVQDYKTMAQSSEKTLESATTASGDFKNITLAKIKELTDELKIAKEAATSRQEALEELTKDLSTSRGEQEKVVDDLKAQINALKTEIETSKSNQIAFETQRNNATEEMKIYKAEATSAKDNYERELALHADARKELQQTRVRLEEESRSHQATKSQLDNFNDEIASEKNAWEDNKRRMEETQKHAEIRLLEAQDQNKILHNQLATLNETLVKIQSEKVDAAADAEGDNDTSAGGDGAALLAKQISELREIVRYQRQEKDVIETQLDSARRTSERERAAADIAKKSLDQLRSEVDILQKQISNESNDVSSATSAEALASKLKQAEDQLVLLRESNAMLRVETEKLRETVESSTQGTESAKNALGPATEKCRELEIDKSSLEAEKASLGREVDLWKSRVQGLVKKFNQIDPEEHSIALKKVADAEKQCATLRAEKEKAENESSTAKSLLTKLRSVVAASKNALAKASAEKEELTKKNSGSAKEAKKDFEELKNAKVKAESDLKSAKLQVEALDTRLGNLKKILVKNRAFATESQQKLDAAMKKEEEALKLLAEEKEAHHVALKEALKNKSTAHTEEHDSVTPLPPSSEQESADSKTLLSQEDTSSKKDLSSESVEDKVPPTPKVPKEGFNFVASKDVTSKDTTAESDSKSSDEKESLNVSNSKSASAEETKPITKEKESSDEIKHVSSSSRQDPAPQKDAKLEESAESASATQTHVGAAEKSDAILPKKDSPGTTPVTLASSSKKEDSLREKLLKKNTSATQTHAGATEKSDAILPKKDSPGSTPVTLASSSKKEDSLREKLLKKKRALEKKIGAPPAKRPTSTPAAEASSTDTGSRKPDVPDVENKPDNAKLEDASKEEESKPEPLEKEAAKTDESAESRSNETKAGEMPQTAPSGQKAVFGLSSNAAPFKMFGGGAKAPTFGTPASNSFGLAGAAVGTFGKQASQPAESAPTFGESVNQASSSSTGGTFLNLKPPGSGFGSSAPLVFGSSSNITLPTPSMDKGQNAFSAFQGTPFGSNPFAPGPASASLFGFSGTKKRSLETEQDSSSQKLAKVEEITVQADKKAEESKPVEAKPESES